MVLRKGEVAYDSTAEHITLDILQLDLILDQARQFTPEPRISNFLSGVNCPQGDKKIKKSKIKLLW